MLLQLLIIFQYIPLAIVILQVRHMFGETGRIFEVKLLITHKKNTDGPPKSEIYPKGRMIAPVTNSLVIKESPKASKVEGREIVLKKDTHRYPFPERQCEETCDLLPSETSTNGEDYERKLTSLDTDLREYSK